MGGTKPTVTLTFAGDSAGLTKAMGQVGEASKSMSDKVGQASKSMQESGKRAEELAEKTDTVDTRAMGFRDTITGLQDGFRGLTDSSLSTQDRLLMLGMGVGDLASGFTNFLIPAVAQAAGVLKTGLLTALNFIAAHPIILVLMALVLIFVLLWTNSETFRRIVIAAFNAVAEFTTRVLGAAWNWLVEKFSQFVEFHRLMLDRLKGWFGAAWDWVISKGRAFLDFYLSMPGRIIGAFMTVSNGIAGAFRSAFNFVARAWNNTIGRLRWTVPGWVPGLGGASISAPQLPTFHTGGVVPGMPGQEVLALLRAGERVTPAGQGGSGVTMTFGGNVDSALASAIMYLIRSGQITIEAA